MRHMKLILAFLLLAALALTAVSCTKGGEETPGTTAPAESDRTNTTEPATDESTEAPTEENTDYDGMDTDNKWTKPY